MGRSNDAPATYCSLFASSYLGLSFREKQTATREGECSGPQRGGVERKGPELRTRLPSRNVTGVAGK